MNGPLDPGTVKIPLRKSLPHKSAGFPGRTSFARALRQRGLLVRAESAAGNVPQGIVPQGILNGWVETAEPWVAVHSTYESHLRRVAMEQAWATLRGERAE